MYAFNTMKRPLNLAIIFLAFYFFLGGGIFAAGGNLISNGDLEIASSSNQNVPAGWNSRRWGTNTTVFQYPVAGVNGSNAARMNVTSYTSGDAKWVFAYVPVTPGTEYQFSDYYIADVSSYVTVQFKMNDGSFTYKDIAHPPVAASFTKVTAQFTIPANVQSVTVFHLLNRVGNLTIDNAELVELTSPPLPDPSNIIRNPSLESVNASGQPINWGKGRWGTNTAVFTFPTSGFHGNKAAKVELTSHTSGDAKWYFDPVSVSAGNQYEFSDYFKSNVRTYITVELKKSDNSVSYLDLGFVDPSLTWTQFKKVFAVPSGVVSLTIFHVIKNVGWLEIDNFFLKKDDSTKFDRGYVSINFDDGWRSMYDTALPILDEAGFKSTQFIVTGRMKEGFASFVKVNEILDMQRRGHEIGAHTRNHVDLTTLSSTEAWNEINGSRQDLFDIGASPVNFFAYPFGAYNSQVIELVKNAGFAAARSSNGGQNLKTENIFTLRRQPMVVMTTLQEVKDSIDKAINDKTWLILLFHEVNNSGREYSVTPELFQQIVDYLKSKNMAPITIEQGVGLMRQ